MDETAWIERYIAPLVTAEGADGLRDDVALLTALGPTIATMDTLVEGTHFLSSDPVSTIGQKLIRVNVSDIHAKGAAPLEALLSISWPQSRSELEFADFMRGIERDLGAFDLSLIGGDLVRTDGPLTLTLAVTGRCIAEAPVRRSSGRPGDGLFINGEIGWGGLGLAAARREYASDTERRYQVPDISSLAAAKVVAEAASASMDVSDGLLIDVLRLATASGVGAQLNLEAVPLAAPTRDIGQILAQCTAGDDYRILLAARTDQMIPGFARIGELTEIAGLTLSFEGQRVNPPSTLGFEH